MFLQIFLLILGFTLLIVGANILVKGASNIAKVLHVSEILIGLTIVALGTSLPELIVSIVSATSGKTDMVMANVIGSNFCNILLILGIITIIKPVKFEKVTIQKNLPLLIAVIFIIIIMSLGIIFGTKMVLTKSDGIILFLLAIVFFIIPIIQSLNENKENNIANVSKSDSKIFIIKDIIYFILGGLALKYGGDFAVNSAIHISEALNISERVIGLTVVAIGTSLPELITSIVALARGNENIAEGNIIGSCILNSCLILGIGSIIANIPITAVQIEDLILLLLFTLLILFFAISNKENYLKRSNGFILIIIYIVYSIKLFI